MIPISQRSTSIFEEEFQFQFLRGDIHILVGTQNVILKFLSKATLFGKVNMEVSPNISKKNTF